MKKLIIFCIFLAVGITSAYANDSAVESAAGGLRLSKEQSVLMEKERLFISEKLVRVEYEFRNTDNKTVSSEVAFPIPPYEYEFDKAPRDFGNFKAWVDGKPIKVRKEVRAFVKEREVTDELRRAGITIDNFGNYKADEDPANNDDEIAKLKPEVLNKLVKVGALDATGRPIWEAHIKYYWHQEFPPCKVVRVKHEYQPIYGYQAHTLDDKIDDICLNDATRKTIENKIASDLKKEPFGGNYYYPVWVSYILTTANTWQTPIKDFELIVKREKDELVSFCWDGPIEKIGDGRFKSQVKDFVPTKELKVYFIRN